MQTAAPIKKESAPSQRQATFSTGQTAQQVQSPTMRENRSGSASIEVGPEFQSTDGDEQVAKKISPLLGKRSAAQDGSFTSSTKKSKKPEQRMASKLFETMQRPKTGKFATQAYEA